ncbi:hypothetical protein DFJ73DRAFT_850223 [Zopfochytrium polystomum]|nr:hypothetical protein DFJ73DRAFT_850223 [Zopfochytrium polystomum]
MSATTPIRFTPDGVPRFDERHVREWGRQLALYAGRLAATASRVPGAADYSHAQQVAKEWRDARQEGELTIQGLRDALQAAYRHMLRPVAYEDIQQFVQQLRVSPAWTPIWEGAIGNLERMRSEMANPALYTDTDLVSLFLDAMDPHSYMSVCQNIANIRAMEALQALVADPANAQPPPAPFTGLLTTTTDITLSELKRAYGAYLSLRHAGPAPDRSAAFPAAPAPTYSNFAMPHQPRGPLALPVPTVAHLPRQLPQAWPAPSIPLVPPHDLPPMVASPDITELTRKLSELTIAFQQMQQANSRAAPIPTVSGVITVDIDAVDVSQVKCWYCTAKGHHRAACMSVTEDILAGADIIVNPLTRRLHWTRLDDSGRRVIGEEVAGDVMHGARRVVRERMRHLGRPVDVTIAAPVRSLAVEVSSLPIDGNTPLVFGDDEDDGDGGDGTESLVPLLGVVPEVFVAAFGAEADLTKAEVLDYFESLPIDPTGVAFRAADVVQRVFERRKTLSSVDTFAAKRNRELEVDWPPTDPEASVVPKKSRAASPADTFGPRSAQTASAAPAPVGTPTAPLTSATFTPAPSAPVFRPLPQLNPPVIIPHDLPVPSTAQQPPTAAKPKGKPRAREKVVEVDGTPKEKPKQVRIYPLAGGEEDLARIWDRLLGTSLSVSLAELYAISPGLRAFAHKQLGGRLQAVSGPASTVVSSAAIEVECGFYGTVESADLAAAVEAAVATPGFSSVFSCRQTADLADPALAPNPAVDHAPRKPPSSGSQVVAICPRIPTAVLGLGTTQITILDSLIDSGSQVSVIDEGIFDAIQASCTTGSYPIRMRSVHGESRDLTRLAAVPFDIQGVRGHLHCFVVSAQPEKQAPFRLLLGQNFIDYVQGQFMREGNALWFQMTSPLDQSHRALVRARGYKRVPSELNSEAG